MTIRDALRKWSPARFMPGARALSRVEAPLPQRGSPIQTRKIIDCPTERRIEPQYQTVSRPGSGLGQIAEGLDRINASLLRAEDAANQRRLRRQTSRGG
jgi:hypothetical protein